MNEIIIVGDIHEGINFDTKIDAETGISARAFDIHNAFIQSVKFAIENHSKLFVIAGDLFDRSHISPGFRELVRKDIFEPLINEGIDIWLIAGNHDQPHSFKRSTSLDDYRSYKNVKLFKKPAKQLININDRLIGAVIVPYLHPEQIIQMVEKSLDKQIPREQWNILSQKIIKQNIRTMVDELKKEGAENVILFAHYYITGSLLGKSNNTQVLPDEFQFTRDMIPDDIDIGIFGHIHIHQQVMQKPPVIYTGSVERVDWGEWKDDKGYISVSLTDDKKLAWKFEKINTRPMEKIHIKLSSNEDNLTNKIISSLPQDVAGKMFRIEIENDTAIRKRIDENIIAHKLEDAFDYEIKYSETSEDTIGVSDFTSDPYEIIMEYIDLNYKKDPRYAELQKRAREILEDVLT